MYRLAAAEPYSKRGGAQFDLRAEGIKAQENE